MDRRGDWTTMVLNLRMETDGVILPSNYFHSNVRQVEEDVDAAADDDDDDDVIVN